MGAVHIGIGHDDDAVVAQLVDIEFLAADATTQGGDQGAHLGGGQHLVEAGLFHIEDLALEGQDGLGAAVAALLGGAAGGVTLHQVEFGQRGVAFLAVGQFARQAGDVQGALAAGHFAGLARGLARPCRFDDLGGNGLGITGIFQQVVGQVLRHRGFHRGLHLRGHQLVLGLGGKLGIRHLHRQYRRQALAGIIPGSAHLGLLGDALAFHVLVEGAGQGAPESGQVSPAIPLGDIVGETEDVFLVGVVPLHGQLDADAVLLGDHVEHLGVQRGLVAVQVLHKGADTALIFKDILLIVTLVCNLDAYPRIQKGQLAQALGEDVVVEFAVATEDFGTGQEADLGAGALRRAGDRQRCLGLAHSVFLGVFLTLATDGELQPF